MHITHSHSSATEYKYKSVADSTQQPSVHDKSKLPFVDNRPEAIVHGKLKEMITNRAEMRQRMVIQAMSKSYLSRLAVDRSLNNVADGAIQFVEDDEKKGQARENSTLGFIKESEKTLFLTNLRRNIYSTANDVLAQINQSARDCPYIVKWFNYYDQKDAAHIADAISKFAPETNTAETIDQYIERIVLHVRTALQKHVDTGTIEDVPAEIIDKQHTPADFLHITKRKGSLVQLSCLNKGGGADGDRNVVGGAALDEIPVPKRRRNCVVLQGQSDIAHIGDVVVNAGTTSCGLVLAFGTQAVGCYHWPFMTNNASYFSDFEKVHPAIGTLQSIVIITNDFPPKSDAEYKEGYLETARTIRDEYSVTTTYYVINGQINGDPVISLADNGAVNSISGTLRAEVL